MPTNDIDWTGLALQALFALSVIWLIVSFIIWAANAWFQPYVTGTSLVTAKSDGLVYCRKRHMYTINLRFEGEEHEDEEVEEELHQRLAIGSPVRVRYQRGRYNNKVYTLTIVER